MPLSAKHPTILRDEARFQEANGIAVVFGNLESRHLIVMIKNQGEGVRSARLFLALQYTFDLTSDESPLRARDSQ